MSYLYLTEQVREAIYHLSTLLDGNLNPDRYYEILSRAISLAESLGKLYSSDPQFYTNNLAKSVRSFFENVREDLIRVVPEDDQHRLAFPDDDDWSTAASLKSDKNNPFTSASRPSNPFDPVNIRPKTATHLNIPLKSHRRQNGRPQRNRRGPTERSRKWAQRTPDKVPELRRGIDFDRPGTRQNDQPPPPATHELPPWCPPW